MCGFLALSISTVAGIAGASAANAMNLTSLDIQPGGKIADEQVSNGWNCTGKNVSPALAWRAQGDEELCGQRLRLRRPRPAAAFWHWWVACLSADATGLERARGAEKGCREARSRFATTSARWATAAPPPKGKPRHYHLTVYALDANKLSADATASPAVVGFNVHRHTLAKATLTGALVARDDRAALQQRREAGDPFARRVGQVQQRALLDLAASR